MRTAVITFIGPHSVRGAGVYCHQCCGRANLLGSRMLFAVMERLTSFMMVEPDIYAERLVPLLVSHDLNGRSGAMFNNKAKAILSSPSSKEPTYASALMGASDKLLRRAIG